MAGPEKREQDPPPWRRGVDQPMNGDREQGKRGRERRPEPDVVERARNARVGMDQKRVVAAVAPAVEVEQRITEKRAPEARRCSNPVGRDGDRPGRG
jgi:hypothetical protein